MADRELRFCEIIKAGDLIERRTDAWTKVEAGSAYIGQMVSEACEQEDRALKFKRIQEKVYVFTIFTNMFPLRGWCCDRGYNYIDDISWQGVKIVDIIKSDAGVTEGGQMVCEPSHYAAPPWAVAMIGKGESYETHWTNYYE